jgi:hypothetical protein
MPGERLEWGQRPRPCGGARLLLILQYIWLTIRVAIYIATYHLRG